ncbi:MAG: STAS domain-containing protein [Steroidobacteraceae bacterium]
MSTPTHDGAGRVVTLGASVTLSEVAGLHQELLAATVGKGLVQIDGRGVQQVDTAGLQLLVAAARRRRRAADVPLRWIGVSQPLLEGFRRLGLDRLLGLQDAVPGKMP